MVYTKEPHGSNSILMTFLADDALSTCIAPKSKSHKRQMKGIVMSYCNAVKYILQTYTANDVISERDSDVLHSTPPSIKSSSKYVETFSNLGIDATKYVINMYSSEFY